MSKFVAAYWHPKSNRILIPALAKTVAGFWLQTEPVETASLSDTDAALHALLRPIRRGNRQIPTPPRDRFPKPILHKYVRVRSERAFELETEMWTIESTALGGFRIQYWQRDPDSRGRIPDIHDVEELPPQTVIEVAAERLLDRIREFQLRDFGP